MSPDARLAAPPLGAMSAGTLQAPSDWITSGDCRMLDKKSEGVDLRYLLANQNYMVD